MEKKSLSQLLAEKKAASLAKQNEAILSSFYEQNETKLEAAISVAEVPAKKLTLAEILAAKKQHSIVSILPADSSSPAVIIPSIEKDLAVTEVQCVVRLT